MSKELMVYFPDADQTELDYLQMIVHDMEESDRKVFFSTYKKKRQQPQTVLILALVGLITVAGIHRFVLGQIGMGLLYLFTGGLCLIGTIMDAVNHKKLAWEYNRVKADETYALMKGRDSF